MDIPIVDGRYRFLLQKWQLTQAEEADLFQESDELLAEEILAKYRIQDSIELNEHNQELALKVKLLAGELVCQYIELVKAVNHKQQQSGRPTPLTNVSDYHLMPEMSIFDSDAGSKFLTGLSSEHGKPIFHTLEIDAGNILLIFNPPPQLAAEWESETIAFYLQLLGGLWKIIYGLSNRFDLSVRRLNYRRAHIDNEVYYALEFSSQPFSDEN